jgi:protease-4
MLTLVLLAGLLVAGWAATRTSFEPGSVLVLSPKGRMTEEAASPQGAELLMRVADDEGPGVRLRDWTEALQHAARDDRISRVLLLLDDFEGAGLPTLREAAAALEAFKASGKPVLAWGGQFDQRSYYLAAHANRVTLHPMGAVAMEGLGRQRTYYKDALDRLGIRVNLLRVGEFKSAGEPYVANAPSPEALRADAHVYDALWKLYTQGVEKARGLAEGSIHRDIDALPASLIQLGGDTARLAREWRLVDAVQSFEEFRAALQREVGPDHKDRTTFRQVGLNAYLDDVRKAVRGDHVAVIVAQGEIDDGHAPAGRIGGLSTSRLIQQAAHDKHVKAIVLRVNSPGGSAYGSELIRQQLEAARAAGKPVVVSMGDVAASGGYWISMASDRVIADAATTTGSIGVFAMLPTIEGLMGKLSVHTGGYRTNWLAGSYDPRQPLDPRFRDLIQSAIGRIYTDFIAKAAAARRMDPARVEAVARGRIWTGQQAMEHGLIDQVGSLADAVQAASRLAQAEAPTLPVRYWAQEPSRTQAIWDLFSARLAASLGMSVRDHVPAATLLAIDPVTHRAAADLSWMRDLLLGRKPFAAVTHCLCEPAL